MEASAFALERLARASQEPMAGKVTLSAPPVLVTHLLARRLADFRRAHPAIQLSVSAQAQQVSLNRREADVALRLVRPRVQLPGSQAARCLSRSMPARTTHLAAARQLDLHRIRRSVFRHAATALAAGHRRPAGHQLRVERYQQPPGGGAPEPAWPACPALAITAPSCCGWNTAGPRSRATSGWWCIATCAVPRPCGPSWTLSPIPSRRNQASALTLLARHWQRAAMNRPGRAQGESARARPAGPPRAGTIAASPGSANPPHQHTPCRNPFRSATAMCLAAISPVLSPTLKCCPPATAELPCLKASR